MVYWTNQKKKTKQHYEKRVTFLFNTLIKHAVSSPKHPWKQKLQRKHSTILDMYVIYPQLRFKQYEYTQEIYN